jgi:hypothetical protein
MSKTELKSPGITGFLWGQIEVESHRPFKYAKIFPGGARQ